MRTEILSIAHKYGLVQVYSAELLGGIARTALPWSDLPCTLCYAGNRVYLEQAFANHCIEAIVIPPDLEEAARQYARAVLEKPGSAHVALPALLVVTDAEGFFYALHNAALHERLGKSPYFVQSFRASSAQVHPSAWVEEHVHLGENVVVGPFCVLRNNVFVGKNSVLGPHVILGEDGLFGKRVDGKKVHIHHFGGVRVEENCHVGSQSVINAATYYGEATTVGARTHLGTRVVVGHDCRLGAEVDISSGAVIGGRCQVGERVWIGPQACISNTLNVGEGASVRLGAVVIEDVLPGQSVSGNFAVAHMKNLWRRAREK